MTEINRLFYGCAFNRHVMYIGIFRLICGRVLNFITFYANDLALIGIMFKTFNMVVKQRPVFIDLSFNTVFCVFNFTYL
ncbi:hypothetical protein D3C71_2048900 [compost metagenome]